MAEYYESKHKFSFKLPEVSDLLKAGVQFGHQSKRWNPKMSKYIYAKRNNIHIIDISYTLPMLEDALDFIRKAALQGEVIFVGTKRQAREIVEKAAIECGAYFIVDRWPGGVLSNFDMTKKNLKKLNDLTKELKEGVENRTKQEISWMKKEWLRLDRLYRGIRTLKKKPTAMFVLDVNLEKGPIKEARQLGIPIVAVVDSNCNPDVVDYIVPGNDDALKSIDLFVNLFKEAVKEGNKGNGVKYEHEDLSKVEVKRIVKNDEEEKGEEIDLSQFETAVQSGSKPKKNESKKTQKAPEIKKYRIPTSVENRVKQEREDEASAKKVADEKKEAKKGKKTSKKAIGKKIKKIVQAELSVRTENALRVAKLKLADLAKMSDDEILKIKGIGAKALEEIKAVLAK